MQAGELIESVVRSLSSRVVVDGVEREHASWSIDREIPGGVTPQVVSGSGIMQTTGTIVWSDERTVKKAGDNPWNPTGWWPDEGQSVEIWVSDGATEWKQFTGVIDQTIGDIGDLVIQSKVIDHFDDLSAKVSHEALLRMMPPLNHGEGYRYCDLVPSYYLDYAFRAAGWYATPKQEPETVLFVPMMGGTWPHIGDLVSAVDFDTSSTTPTNRRTPWGFGVGNARLSYEFRYTRPASTPIQVTIMVAPEHAETCNINLNFSSDDRISLVVGSGRGVTVRSNASGSSVVVCELSSSEMQDATVVTLLVKGTQFSLRNDKDQSASGTGTAATGSTESLGVVAWPEAAIGGLMVNHPTESYLEHRPSAQWGQGLQRRAFIDTSNIDHLSVIRAAPAIVSRTAESVIQEISDALLGAAWIDEHGDMYWATGRAMRLKNVVDTVTTADHVTGLSVNKSLLGSRSLVTVKHKTASISQSRFQMVEVWRGNTKTLGPDDHAEDIITPTGDEEWVQVDTDYTRIGPYNAAEYNTKRGSFMGVTFTQGGDYFPPAQASVTTGFEQIGPDAFKLTHTVNSMPSGVQAETRTPDDGENASDYYSWNRNNSLPLVQAGARVQWEDAEVTPTGVFGAGPELVHDAGYWAGSSIVPQRIATYLQAETQRPMPAITGLDVVADPRRQLADMIRIDSPGLMGVRLRAFVNKIGTSFGVDGLAQTLGVSIVRATSIWQTHQQFSDAGGSLTHAQWNALDPTPLTHTQLNQNMEA